MNELNEQLRTVLTNSFKTLDNFYHYLEIQKDPIETSEIIEKIEKLSLLDNESIRYEFLSKTYYSFIISIRTKDECYYKYKFRYFLYKYQDDKEDAIFGLNFDFRNIGNSIESIIASFALYTSIFSSNNESIRLLKLVLGINSQIVPRILTLVQDNNYNELVHKMGDLWYYPALKADSTNMSLLKNLNKTRNDSQSFSLDRTILNKKPEFITPVNKKNQAKYYSIERVNSQMCNVDDVTIVDDAFVSITPVTIRNKDDKENRIELWDDTKFLNTDNDSTIHMSKKKKSSSSLSRLPVDSAFVINSISKLNSSKKLKSRISPLKIAISNLEVDTLIKPTTPLRQLDNSISFICSPDIRKKLLRSEKKISFNNINELFDDSLNVSLYQKEFQGLNRGIGEVKLSYDIGSGVIDSLLNLSLSTSIDLKYGHYKCNKFLGEGGSSKVYETVNSLENKRYALKIMYFGDLMSKKMVEEEIKILTLMSDSNRSILLKESRIGTKGAIIIMELAIMDLKVFFSENRDIVDPIFILHYWHQMILCVKAMHDRRISHLDLKLQNFVITEKLRVKIIDYGISRELSPNVSVIYDSSGTGTIVFMSPELLRNDLMITPKKCDVWAMGIVLYSLIYDSQPVFVSSNGKPTSASSFQEYTNFILSQNYRFYMPVNRNLTELFKKLMDMCLNESVDDRAQVDEIINVMKMTVNI